MLLSIRYKITNRKIGNSFTNFNDTNNKERDICPIIISFPLADLVFCDRIFWSYPVFELKYQFQSLVLALYNSLSVLFVTLEYNKGARTCVFLFEIFGKVKTILVNNQ